MKTMNLYTVVFRSGRTATVAARNQKTVRQEIEAKSFTDPIGKVILMAKDTHYLGIELSWKAQ